jgi:bifunctional DNase/RNase
MVLFHYDGLSLAEIAAALGLSTAATKSRLHSGRRQLRDLLAPDFPQLASGQRPRRARQPVSERKPRMTRMTIMNVVPLVSRLLVVLVDPPGTRVLPVWLEARHAAALMTLHDPVMFAPADSTQLAGQLLSAAGGTLREVQVQDLDGSAFYATLVIAGREGESPVRAGIADALALAARSGCPIVVGDSLLAERGVVVQDGQPIEDVLIRGAGIPPAVRQSGQPRTGQPGNLDFTDELRGWELRGSFLRDRTGARWHDYECGIDRDAGPAPAAASGFLLAREASPIGYADLRQGVLADPFRGRRIRLTAQVKTRDVTDQAGLYLRVIDPARSHGPEHRRQVTLHATQAWGRHQVETDVPDDSIYVLFGISLTGPGQIWATDFDLQPAPPG